MQGETAVDRQDAQGQPTPNPALFPRQIFEIDRGDRSLADYQRLGVCLHRHLNLPTQTTSCPLTPSPATNHGEDQPLVEILEFGSAPR